MCNKCDKPTNRPGTVSLEELEARLRQIPGMSELLDEELAKARAERKGRKGPAESRKAPAESRKA